MGSPAVSGAATSEPSLESYLTCAAPVKWIPLSPVFAIVHSASQLCPEVIIDVGAALEHHRLDVGGATIAAELSPGG
jgi:hypothetical protein